ncbi:MAG: type II secretion system protein [Candidatus Omnitrophica bacterium]|nr:type II secretion system protein [Candidatus Omnitrophota bacterium]
MNGSGLSIDHGLKKKNSGRPPRPRQAGFTFAEILASMVFVALVIPTALHGIALANRAGAVADRTMEAARLADLKLNEMIISEQWEYGSGKGDFGEDWPMYSWVLTTENWTVDDMKLVTVAVYFEVQQQTYNVRLSTLMDDSE